MKNCLGIAFLLLALMACNISTSKKKMIAKKWAYHEIATNGKVLTSKELGNPVIAFNDNGFYKLSYGPMSDSGKWELKSDTTFYTISDVSNQSQDLVILKLTKDTFRLKYPLADDLVTLTMVPAKED